MLSLLPRSPELIHPESSGLKSLAGIGRECPGIPTRKSAPKLDGSSGTRCRNGPKVVPAASIDSLPAPRAGRDASPEARRQATPVENTNQALLDDASEFSSDVPNANSSGGPSLCPLADSELAPDLDRSGFGVDTSSPLIGAARPSQPGAPGARSPVSRRARIAAGHLCRLPPPPAQPPGRNVVLHNPRRPRAGPRTVPSGSAISKTPDRAQSSARKGAPSTLPPENRLLPFCYRIPIETRSRGWRRMTRIRDGRPTLTS